MNVISTAMSHAVDLAVPLQIFHSWFAGSSSRGQRGGRANMVAYSEAEK